MNLLPAPESAPEEPASRMRVAMRREPSSSAKHLRFAVSHARAWFEERHEDVDHQ
jgi:hypothetical protein